MTPSIGIIRVCLAFSPLGLAWMWEGETGQKWQKTRPGHVQWVSNWKGAHSCHPLVTPHRRTATSITCTVPRGTLPALVPVCVRFESRGCVHGNLTFWYMQNPVITAIRPGRSPVR